MLFNDNQDAIPGHPDSFASVYGEESTGFSQTEVRNVALRLMELATSLAADLNAHDVHVSKVDESLTSTQSTPTMESLLAVVDRLVETNEAIKSKLRDSRDRIMEQASEIESAADLANTDALTQIGNRRRFDLELAAWDGSTPGVLAMMDIDHFKKFNDDHGHRAGDEVLKAVASVLRSQLSDHCIDSLAIGKQKPAIRFDWVSKPSTTQFSQAKQEALLK